MDGYNIKIPTGYIIVDKYSRGKLETLSIGDYGKQANIKADFLGYTNEINGVPNQRIKPLSDKWVITLSTQYGCPMKCIFCDVPNIRFNGNATFDDLKYQLYNAIRAFNNIKYTDRLNIHYARMGEPSFNKDVLKFTRWLHTNKIDFQNETGLRVETIHPVFTTCLPNTLYHEKILQNRLNEWCDIKNNLFNGQAGLQFSINSTNDKQRYEMFRGLTLKLEQIAEISSMLPEPIGRKYCLNFAYASDFEIDAEKLSKLFDTDKFMCKITPIHNNNACEQNNLKTHYGYDSYLPYKKPEEELKKAGFDVLVFVPSMDEEDGCVTCGNAILGGSEIKNN